MYKSFTANELRNLVGLPTDYKVNGFISYGVWDNEKHFNNVGIALNELGIKHTTKKLNDFLSHILEITIGENIYWFATVYGSALLSEYIHLVSILGSENNIHIGSCGGLFPEMNPLDLVLPEWSYGKESSASMYDRENKDFKYYSNEKLSKHIEQIIDKKYKVWKGPVVSCQAMLGETQEDIQSWSKEGYYAVEMETATVFSVSKHFKVPSASLMYVGDNLIKGQVVGDESHTQQKTKRDEIKKDIYKIAFKTILDL